MDLRDHRAEVVVPPPEPANRWWLAPIASVLFPGLGHLLIGRRLRAALFGVPTLMILMIGVITFRQGSVGLLELLVRPSTLWAVFGANAVLLGLRVVAFGDTIRLVERPYGVLPVVVAVLGGLFIAAPHVVVGGYSLDAIDLLESVFGEPQPVATADELLDAGYTEADLGPPPPPPTTVPPVTTTTLPPPPVTIRANIPADQVKLLIPEGDRNPIRPVITPTEASMFDAPFEADRLAGERITVLLAGGDAGPGRSGLRTDVMMVATIDLDTRDAAIFGIPRNLGRVPLPQWMARSLEGVEDRFNALEDAAIAATTTTILGVDPPPPPERERCECFADILNALYVHTHSWVRTFPDAVDPGMEALRIVLADLLGLRIDYYVLVDFGGFVDVIDALGGVEVTVTEAMDVGFSPAKEGEDPVRVSVEPGRHRLDGREALAYVRNRTGSSDYVRMERQRCMLASLAEQTDPVNILRSFPSLVDAIESATTTNIPLSILPDLVGAVAGLNGGSVATVAFQPPYYTPERDFRGAPIPSENRIRATVASVLTEGTAGVRDGAPECP